MKNRLIRRGKKVLNSFLILLVILPFNLLMSIQSASAADVISRDAWELEFVTSEEIINADQPGIYAFDDDTTTTIATSTFWHSVWGTAVMPQEIQIDLGARYDISGFKYLPRTDGGNGNIKDYKFYVSNSTTTWVDAVTGVFPTSTAEQEISFNSKIGRYIRFIAETEQNDEDVTVVRDLNVIGEEAPLFEDAMALCDDYESAGKTVVRFTESDQLVQTSKLESSPTSTNILAGVYEVALVSYDGYPARIGDNQEKEQWRAILRDSSDNEIATTSASSDLADNVKYVINDEYVNGGSSSNGNLIVSTTSTSVIARHAGDSASSNSVYPVCAVFEFVSDLPNQPPVAVATTTTPTVILGDTIHFDGSGSSDSDGTIDLYEWDFGDGIGSATTTATTTDYTYNATGTFNVMLTVTDNDNATGTDTVQITVEETNPINEGDVIINELMWMGSATSTADEWIELKNNTTSTIDLSDCYLMRLNNSTPIIPTSTMTSIEPNGFYLVSYYNATNSKINIETQDELGYKVLSNTALEIKLYCGNDLIDTAGDGSNPLAGFNGAEIDDYVKKSMSRENNYGTGTSTSDWCTASLQINWDNGAIELGTPGAPNYCGISPECGNNIKEDSERCDDGNIKDGDGCSSTCQIESIYGYKFNDENNNGADDSEIKLGGWIIELYDDANATTSIATATTAATTTATTTLGHYSFENLAIGDYWVKEIQQTDWAQTTSTTTATTTISTATSAEIVIFGNYYAGPTSVYECSDEKDNDGDGLIDADDPGCHTDGDASNTNTYDPNDDDESNTPSSYCGDGICDSSIGETCSTCSQDCGSCGGGGGGGGSVTPKSIVITNEKVSYLGSGEALVTWTTNIETTRQVAYGDNSISALGSVPEYGYDSVNEESTSMTTEHSVVITGLTDGIPYYFRPISDRSGTTGEKVGTEVFYIPGEEPAPLPTPASTPTPIPAECNYLLEYIKLGESNNPVEVEKLERFLNEFENENLEINGIYEQVDFDAVSRFQEKYLEDVLNPWSHDSSTGYVYITTKKKINEIYCQMKFSLTSDQEAEISLFSSTYGRAGQPSDSESGIIAEGEQAAEVVVLGEELALEDEIKDEEQNDEEGQGTVEGENAGAASSPDSEDGASNFWSEWWWLIILLLLVIAYFAYENYQTKEESRESGDNKTSPDSDKTDKE